MLIPNEIEDENVRDFLNELVRQVNTALADIENKIKESRSDSNGKSYS